MSRFGWGEVEGGRSEIDFRDEFKMTFKYSFLKMRQTRTEFKGKVEAGVLGIISVPRYGINKEESGNGANKNFRTELWNIQY